MYNILCLGRQSAGYHTTPGLHCGRHAKECRSATQFQTDPVQVCAQLCCGQWGTEAEMAESHPSSCHRGDTRRPKWASRHLDQPPRTQEKVRMLNSSSCQCGVSSKTDSSRRPNSPSSSLSTLHWKLWFHKDIFWGLFKCICILLIKSMCRAILLLKFWNNV